MSYLDLVEDYDQRKAEDLSQFDKVLYLSARAKDIYGGKTSQLKGLERRKATAVAQYELRAGLILPDVKEREFEEEEEDYEDF